MTYRSLRECVDDLKLQDTCFGLKRNNPHSRWRKFSAECFRREDRHLLRQSQRLPFSHGQQSFGTMERARYMFRHTLRAVERFIDLKVNPACYLHKPWEYLFTACTGLNVLPRRVRKAAVMECETTISDLPQLVSWQQDGGAFITLPQVYTEHPFKPGFMNSNLGMYRVQLSGNVYIPNEEIGLHYQIHRGIGVHHAAAIEKGESLRANIFVGGPPAMTLAAVMPLPEGIPELLFAGALGGRRVPLYREKSFHCRQCGFLHHRLRDPEQRKPGDPLAIIWAITASLMTFLYSEWIRSITAGMPSGLSLWSADHRRRIQSSVS